MSSLLNFTSAGLSVAEARRAVSWVALRVCQTDHQPTGLVASPLRKGYLRVSEENECESVPQAEPGPQRTCCSGITVSLLSMNFQKSLKRLFRKSLKRE